MKCITLTEHLNSSSIDPTTRAALTTMGAVGHRIYREVNRAGVVGLLGEVGRQNVQGEDVKKLDEYSNDLIVQVFRENPIVGNLISEEMTDVCRISGAPGIDEYLLTFDPLDGSSNIDVNVTVGTIFALYRVPAGAAGDTSRLLQAGEKMIAAGYVLYGPTLNFVFWRSGATVQGFTFDPVSEQFVLTNPNMRIPESSSTFSVNDGNYTKWDDRTRKVVDYLRDGRAKSTARYVGSLVADFHRNLLKGGVYLYPADTAAPEGKIRLLYEAAPLAKVVVEAGGRATTGFQDILAITPKSPHHRCPTILGSAQVVREIERLYQS